MGHPSVFPTSTTIYYPDECYNGYTVYTTSSADTLLVDMNGNIVKVWQGLEGFPARIYPGGYLMASTGKRDPQYGYLDMLDLIQVDWDGNVVWKFSHYERIQDGRRKARWMARQHHDYQREGNPVGYYAPGMDPLLAGGNTLILCHKNVSNKGISEKPILDDTFIEVSWEGKVIWEWLCSDHFEELGFDEAALNAMYRNPNMVPVGGGIGDYMHVNSLSALGPNKWFDAGDERFNPDNLIWDGRQANIIAITDKRSGKIVWKLGPDFTATKELRTIGQIIGQHHAHIIPRGLPGEGNLLLFDNGGRAGFGAPNPSSTTGHNNAWRDHSRVLEINPLTLEIVWTYSAQEAGYAPLVDDSKFYSVLVSSVQRLPNGNTLICEGSGGRFIEVRPDAQTVWEYISPYWDRKTRHNQVYRAYRVPYDWVPQLEKPQEVEVPRLDNSKFRVGEIRGNKKHVVTKLRAGGRVKADPNLCVVPPTK